MILIVTNKRDVTTDFVIRALRATGTSYCRLNTEDVLHLWRITWRTCGWKASSIHGRSIDSSEITGGYYRRPRAVNPLDGTAIEAGSFVTREAGALLRGLIAHTLCHWISSPSAIEIAEDKLWQLRLAASLGMSIPNTIITNEPEVARDFIQSVGHAIVKPLSSGHLGDDPVRVAYTTGITSEDDLTGIALAPHLLQERVKKTAEVRVTVVDDIVFACRLASQAFPETALDWRRASMLKIQLEHRMIDLPSSVVSQCIALTHGLGLRFGAIDLIEGSDGYTFLEINPNGQWAWIEERTDAPISHAIASALTTNTRRANEHIS